MGFCISTENLYLCNRFFKAALERIEGSSEKSSETAVIKGILKFKKTENRVYAYD